MAGSCTERQQLAERWRRLGEKLRERSPALYAKLLEMLAASALGDDDGEDEKIDDFYPSC